MLSDPALSISILKEGAGFQIRKNGSKQASFIHCKRCDQLLAVASNIEGNYRGAVNAFLFESINFDEAVTIRPRLLSKTEKLQRWKAIWGSLKI